MPPTAEPNQSGADSPAPRPAWQRNLPNALTIARVVMTAAFVAVLSVYRFPDGNTWALPIALVLFVVAALTDALDGYLARRWQVVSVFGRIMDPFADKVLILGAFVMLAGPGFHVDAAISTQHYSNQFSGQITGVASWMVIVILARELLVTTIRAVLEGKGIDFSAATTGKLKMIAQSIGAPAILLLSTAALAGFARTAASVAETDLSDEMQVKPLLAAFGVATMMAMWSFWVACIVTLITAVSAIPYITRAMTALRKPA